METPPETTRTEPPHGDPLGDEWRRDEWRGYAGEPPPRRSSGLDFSAFFVLLDALRRAAPGELQDSFTRMIREGLLALRSLIDWYLERLDRPPREPRVEDIPID